MDGLGNEFFAAAPPRIRQVAREVATCAIVPSTSSIAGLDPMMLSRVSLAEVVGELLFLFEPLIAVVIC